MTGLQRRAAVAQTRVAVALLAILAGVLLSTRTATENCFWLWIQKTLKVLARPSRTIKEKKDPPSVAVVGEDTAILSNGNRFPLASFGLSTYESDQVAYNLTRTALQAGFRHLFVDTQHQRAVAQACVDSGVSREDLFLAGSIHSSNSEEFIDNATDVYYWTRDHRNKNVVDDDAYEFTRRSGRKNMQAFAAGSVYYLDQILLDYSPGSDCDYLRGQWRALEDMVQAKQVKSLAVSNFSPKRLDCLLQDSKVRVKPVVHQLCYNVAYHPAGILQENQQRKLLVQAWSPLGGSMLGSKFNTTIRSKCADIGKKYGNKSWAQVALRWIVQKGAAFTTHCTKKEHFAENVDIFDFELSFQDMAILDALAS